MNAADLADNQIVVELLLVLGIAAILAQYLGPIISSMIEAVKPTGLLPQNWAGVYAIVFSAILGMTMGFFAMLSNDAGDNAWRFVLYGLVAGAIGPGAGAVREAQTRSGIEDAKFKMRYPVEDVLESQAYEDVPDHATVSATNQESNQASSSDDEDYSEQGALNNLQIFRARAFKRDVAGVEKSLGQASAKQPEPSIVQDPDAGPVAYPRKPALVV